MYLNEQAAKYQVISGESKTTSEKRWFLPWLFIEENSNMQLGLKEFKGSFNLQGFIKGKGVALCSKHKKKAFIFKGEQKS
mgnify:CR=1 FL=1